MPKKKDLPYSEYKKELDRQIRAQDFRHATLISGSEDYLRRENSKALCKAILGDGDTMNYAHFQGNAVSLDEVLSLAGTLPFFSEHRVIFLEETGLFAKAGSEGERLSEALEQMPETTYYVFSESSVNGQTKLARTVKKIGWIMNCNTPDEGYLRRFVHDTINRYGLSITPPAVQLLLDYTGDDMLNIRNECIKLADYCYGRKEAGPEDVKAICSIRVQDHIFDMIAAVASGNRDRAMNIYMDLLQLQTAPQQILALMIRQFNQLLQVGELRAKGKDSTEIAAALKLNPWVLDQKIIPLVRGKSGWRLQKALQDCVQASMDYRSGRISAQLAVEKLLIRYSAPGALAAG